MIAKKKKYKFYFIYLLLLIAALYSIFTYINRHRDEGLEVLTDLSDIRERGVLNVAVDYNSINYFIYRGKPMGYQYELIQALCKKLEIESNFIISNNLEESIEGLKNGSYDILATNITITRDRQNEVAFTTPLKQTRQVIVQRKLKYTVSDSMFIQVPGQLVNKIIYVNPHTPYDQRLQQISEEIGGKIHVIHDSVNQVEQLVAMVSDGEIDYTVCDENLAVLYRSYFPNLDVSLKISYPQNIAWAVNKEASELKAYLDEWIYEFKQSAAYRKIYHAYFESPRIASRFFSEYHTISGGKISAYDDLVKRLAAKYDWDWRLISSIIFHESRFEPEVESWGGAVGLMQLMPSTAESFGVEDIKNPGQNVDGGIQLLNWLEKQLVDAVPDSSERIKFILAAYNIGLGPVLKARKLAYNTGKDNHVWSDVSFYLKNEVSLIQGEDSTSVQEYARGEEAVNFVDRVLHNYQHYCNIIPE